jgi:hypothetical protein
LVPGLVVIMNWLLLVLGAPLQVAHGRARKWLTP